MNHKTWVSSNHIYNYKKLKNTCLNKYCFNSINKKYMIIHEPK